MNRKEYPYTWERITSEGMEDGAYAKANGDGTVTVLEFSPSDDEFMAPRIIPMEGVTLTRARGQAV